MNKLLGNCVVAACIAMGATVVAATGTADRRVSESPAVAHARALYQSRTLADSSGHYNAALIQSAVTARHMLLARRAQPLGLATQGPVFAAAAAPAVNWTEIGPGNVGGRINTIWVDPSNGQHLIVGAAGGGLWQSLDGGTSWTAIADFPGTLAVGAFAQVSSSVFLAGTGDQFNEPQPGIGMVTSTDGGNTWTPINSTAPSSTNPDWYYVNSITVSSAGVILAATGVPVYGSNSDLLNTTEPGRGVGGIYRSTDSGQSWIKVWPTAGGESPSLDVVFDPSTPGDAVADNEMGSVVFSTDGGQTWSAATGLPAQTAIGYRVSLAFDSSTAGSVYALVDNAPSGPASGEVFHSTNGGQSWTLLAGTGAFVNQHAGTSVGALCDNTISPAECQGDYDNVITVFPQGVGKQPLIFAAGVDVFASADGGTSWTEVGSWLAGDADYIHGDHHAMAASSSMYFEGNDGGMYELPVGSTSYTWTEINSGLAVTQFYRIDGHSGVTASSNGGITPILAGSQDNGMQLYEGYSASGAPQPDDWVQFFGGDGVGALVDPVNGNFLYGSYVYLDMTYSLSGGPTGQFFGAEPPDNTANPSTTNFISPMKLVPDGTLAATQMLAGGASLWLGTNIQSGTPAWSSLNGTTLPIGTSGNYIDAIEIDPNTNNNVWLGYDDGEIWHTTNATATGGPSWSKITSAVLPTNQQITDLWVVPGQSGTIYMTVAGFQPSGGNIFESTDGGTTWTGIGRGLPPGPVYSLVTDPNYPQILYAGTLTGVYTSQDNGQTWSTSNVGPANISVNQLTWFSTGSPPILLAATDGRGAWMGSPAYNPTPTLTGIAPAQVTAGAGTTTITLTGTGFVSNSTVNLDGAAIAATYVSSTQLQVSLTAFQLAQAGTHTFTVVNPIPGGGTSAGATLTVANPSPVIASLAPAQVLVGASATTITLTGTGFVSSSTVNLDGAAIAATYVSSTELQVALAASQLAQAGTHTFTVTNPAPGGGTSAGAAFTVAYPAPAISSLSPTTVQAGSAGFTLTVSGTGFVAASSVSWNGTALPTTFSSATQLTAAVPASDVASEEAVTVTVSNPTPGGGTSAGVTFTVSANNGSGGGGGGGSSGGGGGAQSGLVLLLLTGLFALKKHRKAGQS